MSLQLLSLIRYIVLANVLGISNMGLLGIAMLSLSVLQSFTETGLQVAIIQKKGKVEQYLDTVWTVGFSRAILLASTLFFAAPLLAMIKADPGQAPLTPEQVTLTINIIRAISLCCLIKAFGNIGTILYTKNLRFDMLFIIDVLATLSNVIVTVILVLIYRSVWSLVIGKLTAETIKTILSYTMHPHRPKIKFDSQKFFELWKYGKWIMGSSILGFLNMRGDDIFLAAYLGSNALAIYNISCVFSEIPASQVTRIISQVAMPTYSKLQGDTQRLRNAYFKVLTMVSFLAVPIAVMIAIFSHDFVTLILTDKWTPAIHVMQILAIRGFFWAIGGTRPPVFKAVGKPGIATKLAFIKLISLAILLYPMARYFGIIGIAMTMVIISLVAQPFSMKMLAKVLQCKILDTIKPTFFPLLASAIMAIAVMSVRNYLFDKVTFGIFVLLAAFAVIVYLAAAAFFSRFCDYNIKEIILENLNALRS